MGLIRLFMELNYKSNPGLKDLTGVYRGYAPTDESPIFVGELEVSISTKLVKSRLATGLKIKESQIPASEFIKMSREELCDLFLKGNNMPDHVAGFYVHGYQYLFPLHPNDDIGLMIRRDTTDPLERSILYSSKQVHEGNYLQWVAKIEGKDKKGGFPTLRAGGRASAEFYKNHPLAQKKITENL